MVKEWNTPGKLIPVQLVTAVEIPEMQERALSLRHILRKHLTIVE